MIDNISKVYAKALYEISSEKDSLDIVKDFQLLTELINSSNDLENLLFFESFSAEEKLTVINELFTKDDYSEYFKNFVVLLIKNKRITYFHQIFKEIMVLDDDSKGFLRGTIEGAAGEIDPKIVTKLKVYLENKIGKKIILKTVISENITAGVRAVVGDLLLDATLEHQFDLLKKI